MDIEIKQLHKKDFNTARKFAIVGMHLYWYTSNRFELYIYNKYFWYTEILRATTALGAYIDGKLAGVLLADINGAPKIFNSFWCKIFIKLVAVIMSIGYKASSGSYNNVNAEMLKDFQTGNKTDGELNFFAVDPNITGKGIGTLLLNELERQAKGKFIYLFTDSGSTYQFYDRRGFTVADSKEITLSVNNKKIPLDCLLFYKQL